MRYLITYTEEGIQKAFYTEWFDIENNFNADVGMIVFDLAKNKYLTSNLVWLDIEFDHL
jgi:hypothetical protein